MVNFFSTLFFIFILPLWVNADTLSVTSYYPAPFGAYKILRFAPRAEITTTPCNIGTFYTNTNQNDNLYFCRDDGTGNGQWGLLPTTWINSNDNVYLSDTANPTAKRVGIGTSAPEFKLTLQNDAGILAIGQFGDVNAASLTTSGPGARFIWYPKKAALRAGLIIAGTGAYASRPTDQWNDVNIGNYSVAFGRNSKASGAYSQVSGGDYNSATGNYSAAAGGFDNQATGDYSIVSMNQNTAAGTHSVAIGSSNNAGGNYSAAYGVSSQANGLYSAVNGGESNQASNNSATVGGGKSNVASALYSTVAGGNNQSAEAHYTTTRGGLNSKAKDFYSTISGGSGHETREYSTVVGGLTNLARRDHATVGGGLNNHTQLIAAETKPFAATIAGGFNNGSPADYDFLGGGGNNSISGIASVIIGGDTNTISAQYCVIGGGSHNTINGDEGVVLGGSYNLVGGIYSWAGGSHMKVFGNHTFAWGYSAADVNIMQSDAFIIYSGNVGIGTATPAQKLHVNGNAQFSAGNVKIVPPPAATGSAMGIDASGKVGTLDLAEIFTTSEEVDIGDILVIDEKEKMRLRKSQTSYDQKVIGVVSGAPAVIFEGRRIQLSPQPFHFTKGARPPVALVGRVPCKVSLENGPISSGDLLTSSSIPGHAMRATDRNKSLGAVIGKALESFRGGPQGEKTGLITVSVKLQ